MRSAAAGGKLAATAWTNAATHGPWSIMHKMQLLLLQPLQRQLTKMKLQLRQLRLLPPL